MKHSSVRSNVIKTMIMIAGFICLSTMAPATTLSDYEQIRHWEYTYFQSMVTYVSPLHDYIVTAKRRVLLVEARHNGETLATRIQNLDGEDITVDAIKAGQWVYVWGGVLSDHSIGAKDIVLLPGNLSNSEMAEHRVIQTRKKFVYSTDGY